MISVRDPETFRSQRPFLVAHRGGVIAPEAPENSLRAIELAAAQGYAMVELDLVETADDEPVLMHGRLVVNCGVDGDPLTMNSSDLAALRYRESDQHVLTLAQGLDACARLGLGVMLDFKLRYDRRAGGFSEPGVAFVERVAALVRETGLAESTVCIDRTPFIQDILGDVSLFPVSDEDADRVTAGKAVPLDGRFWFDRCALLPSDVVTLLHANGALVIPAVNTFHYPVHAHDALARQDIDRLRAAGVDGFQIDSVYAHHFKG